VVNLKNEARKDNPDGKKLIQHLFLSSLLSFKKKFRATEIVICCDSKHYWRKDFFPYYKGNRKEGREKSDIDWEFVFEEIDKMKNDLREYFPYKVIEVDGAEADDVIATLTKYMQTNNLVKIGLFDGEPKPINIVSSDGDYVQLQKYKNVKQYSPMHKKMITPKMSISDFLIEHIVKGDAIDAIPNILSPDNSIVDHIRQKPISSKFLKEFQNSPDLSEFVDSLSTELKRNYIRNKTLVDFSMIPDDVYNRVVAEYESYQSKGSKNKILTYMIKNGMKHLMENLSDF
jgi:hypothetical protein